ncbi:MAG: LolA family protein [Terriglobia bacterium]
MGTWGCAVSRTRHIAPSALPGPPQAASESQLIARINAQSAAVESLVATVDLEPSAGSVYSGVIKQYHDVKGFLLVRKPDFVRMTGQAPVVRTDIFDMASDGRQFSLYIPSENKYYVGATDLPEKPGKALENLRPQHILDALLLRSIDPAKDSYFVEDVDRSTERDYVIAVLGPYAAGRVSLKRKIWFNRTNLEISRVQIYGADGVCMEDVRYSDYGDFGGVNYPARIAIRRPVEDYSLSITLLNARFNQPVPLSKFVLKKPASAQVINLSGRSQLALPAQVTQPSAAGAAHGQ